VQDWEKSMTTETKTVKREGLAMAAKTAACVAVLLAGAFVVVKPNRTAAAAPVAEAGAPPSYQCPVQATGNGVAIPDIDPNCL
jgi:hypothetical protein